MPRQQVVPTDKNTYVCYVGVTGVLCTIASPAPRLFADGQRVKFSKTLWSKNKSAQTDVFVCVSVSGYRG